MPDHVSLWDLLIPIRRTFLSTNLRPVRLLVWLAGYAVAIAKAGRVLARPRVRRALEGVTGAALVALGARLALGSR